MFPQKTCVAERLFSIFLSGFSCVLRCMATLTHSMLTIPALELLPHQLFPSNHEVLHACNCRCGPRRRRRGILGCWTRPFLRCPSGQCCPLPNGREMFVSVVDSSSARRAEPMKFPLAQDWNSHETIRLICEFTDDNQITSHAHSLFNLSSSIPLVLSA